MCWIPILDSAWLVRFWIPILDSAWLVRFWIPLGWTLDFGFRLVGLGWCGGDCDGWCLVTVGLLLLCSSLLTVLV